MDRAINEIKKSFYGPHGFVQTSPCGRGQHHLHGLVGVLWLIKDPESVRVGHCFMDGRLKAGDLWLGIEHSGDCFQTYMFVKEYENCLVGNPELTFGSYGIGDSVAVELEKEDVELLTSGGRVYLLCNEIHREGSPRLRRSDTTDRMGARSPV